MSISLGQTVLSIVLVSFVLFSPSDNYIKLIDAVHLTIVSVSYIVNIILIPVVYAFVINTEITEQSVFLKDIIMESTIKRSNLVQEISDALEVWSIKKSQDNECLPNNCNIILDHAEHRQQQAW